MSHSLARNIHFWIKDILIQKTNKSFKFVQKALIWDSFLFSEVCELPNENHIHYTSSLEFGWTEPVSAFDFIEET